ncbi:metal-dependent hydrolase [Cohnella nanjingensis]|uniref:Metal-dependent hydrolase n=1 Tax=Cohnella nanjingensis TaxID=1387779 RepID=A0A7X0RS91_9BACL|nr:metal-dependent hydrolase [Cohnella nanjingensis]MBB6672749.1 metal-dependent hydrolase [Cohnella nanjingensis]
MKGSTHLAIGVVIGAAAACYYPFDLKHAAYYVTVAGFSALSPDLDGNNLLSAKLGKLSRLIRRGALGLSALAMAVAAYLLIAGKQADPKLVLFAVPVFLLMLVAGNGAIRNALVSLCGGGLLYAGFRDQLDWLVGFGIYVAWAPWLAHRGMTHTIWATALWGWIGLGLERYLGVPGIAMTAVVGYASHLVADTLTPSGVKWLFPLYGKSIKLRVF